MLLKRFYDDQLAQASYLVGCAATGEAMVIDANRDVQQYLDAAAAEGLRVAHVTETHIHADFVSGSRELAARSGARLYLSAMGGPDWLYAFAGPDGATLLRDGDRLVVGNIRVEVLHTPGHTPEHLSFLVTDGAATDQPFALFTGDFVFVGDVGRPDLLEKAAHVAHTMEASARTLHRSLARFRALPEYVQVFPGHGAGSACGKALGALPSSTVGYELRTNWALQPMSEDVFVAAVLEGQPDPPRYFAEMKRVNREGPPAIGALAAPPLLPASDLPGLRARGAVPLDVRSAGDFAAAHVAGAVNIVAGKSFSTWAGWLLPYDRDLVLVAADERQAAAARRALALVGLDRVVGWFGPEILAAERRASGEALPGVAQLSAAALAAELATEPPAVLDVRNAAEWAGGHLHGAVHIPLGDLPARLAEVPRDRPLVVHCAAGMRSAIAVSLLQRAGLRDVRNLAGGFGAWTALGLPVERPAPVGAAS